jgi:GNAT superfamily N-acetyltransferase
MMIIRRAKTADAGFIQQLLGQLGYPDLTEGDVIKKIQAYAHDPFSLLVSEIEGRVVGFISLHWFDIFHSPGKIGRITAFCVAEKFRSDGIGSRLLEEAESFFSTKGCTKFEVTSNARRTLAHDFYLKKGYIEDSKRFVKMAKAS